MPDYDAAMILVTGATGNIGSEVARLLLESGHRFRVLTRDPARAAHLTGRAEVAQGDFSQPETLAAAFAGIEKTFIVTPAGEDLPVVLGPVFEAARRAGVRHVVMVSSGTIAMQPEVAIGRWHRLAEEKLKESGLAWTMLRPGNFASNSLRWASMIKSQGTVFGPGNGQSAVIDPRDIAAVGAAALTTPAHEGKTHVLTGPELLSASDQVRIIGDVIGRPLKFVEVPEAGARMGMIKSGMPERMADALIELMRAVKGNQEAYVSPTVREVLAREGRPFVEWVRDNRAAFV